jgi:hypothetical protein
MRPEVVANDLRTVHLVTTVSPCGWLRYMPGSAVTTEIDALPTPISPYSKI